jgi:formylglycine-generating enzyme required for sulfatase activity
VSWEDCQRFLELLNRQVAGLVARLPTEAEWERACRRYSELHREPPMETNEQGYLYARASTAVATYLRSGIE